MKDKTIYFPVSAIRNVWLRRSVILLTFPLFVLFNAVFATIAWFVTWADNNAGLIASARKQWRRKEQ